MGRVKSKSERTKIRDRWNSMKSRCYSEKHTSYKYYGARGIKVCDEWIADFENFYKWAKENGYRDDLTLDRIDPNGNYEPDNCRWVDASVQNANRRKKENTTTEYIGVYLHTNRSCYVASIGENGKVVFWYSDRSKNRCAIARNDYILEHNLPHPLNDIKEEFEDVRIHKTDCLYKITRKSDGVCFYGINARDISDKTGISVMYLYKCLEGKRNSSKYIFEKIN